MRGPGDRLDDDALASHLQRRAARAHLPSAELERIIATATAAQSVRPTGTRWNILSAPLAAALVVALVVGVIIVGSIPSVPAAVPSSSASLPSSAAPRVQGLRALTPAEVEAALSAPWYEAREGSVVADVVIDVGTESLSPCHPGGTCLVGQLRLPGASRPIYAAEEVRLALDPGEHAGRFGLSISSLGPQLTLLGTVQPGSPGLSSTVPDVLARAEEIGIGDLRVVEGWLVAGGDGTIRCSRPDDDPFDGPLRCEPTDWIAESPDEPVQLNDGSGWLRMPGPALTVQPHAAGKFAWYDPDADGPPEPRREAFLVRAKEDVSIDCGGCHQWDILGRIDPVGPPEPVEAPEPGPTLPPIVVRAWSAVPDANVPLPQALSLVATASKWLIPWDSEAGTSWADRPLAPARVDVTDDRAVIEFHDYGDGGKVLVEFLMRDGAPVSIESVTTRVDQAATLSAWEQQEAQRLAMDATHDRPFDEVLTRVTAIPCPTGDGWCARVELVTDEPPDLPRSLAEVIVDIGREEVLLESPALVTPPPP